MVTSFCIFCSNKCHPGDWITLRWQIFRRFTTKHAHHHPHENVKNNSNCSDYFRHHNLVLFTTWMLIHHDLAQFWEVLLPHLLLLRRWDCVRPWVSSLPLHHLQVAERERERECKTKVKDNKKYCKRDMKPENLLLDKEGHLKVRKTKHLTFSQDQTQTFTDHWLWLRKEDHWQNVDLVWHSRVPGSWNNPIQGNVDWRDIHTFGSVC